MEKIPMTAEGLEPLKAELHQLKAVERYAVIKQIAEAREHGDLSENAEYHAARERQSFIEGRISELEDIVSRADVIDLSKLSGGKTVRFGASVTVADVETDEETTYQLVGPYEADLKKNKISVQSPLGRALIGKTIGDTAEVSAPGGSKGYEVLSVKFK
ncbi:MAG: transcription elongation factor GreA [Proteobacteria bacterium]|nr:transcription elongation factor GreA [Pseudomonadota bacterium]MCC6913605.1 transcription elongation factor GreA [Rhodospirillaceae bacterium]